LFVGLIYNQNSYEKMHQLAKEFLLPLFEQPEEPGIYLACENDRLCLLDNTKKPLMKLHLDFAHGRLGYRLKGSGSEDLLKAIGKLPDEAVILDATMGFAEDTLLLAKTGKRLIACEQDPVVFLLVREALQLSPVENLQIQYGNAIDLMPSCHADVIYLDPMFLRKIKAKEKKEIQFLQQIVGPATPAEDLLKAALDHAKMKVVVKRASKAAPISGPKPSYQIEGKSVRFDVYRVD